MPPKRKSKRGIKNLKPINTGHREFLDTGAKVEVEGREYPDYVGMAIRYANLVISKDIPACRYIIMAAKRFLKMKSDAEANLTTYYFSDVHVIEVCAFAETLKQTTGDFADVPFVLQPYQIWCRAAVYGFRKKSNGRRLVRFWIEEIARKNGKSFDAATTGLYELGPNATKKDDISIIASSEKQAKKVLVPMQDIVMDNPQLKEKYGATKTNDTLRFEATNSEAEILPAKGENQDGHNPKLVIADEFHRVPPSIYNVMRSSQGSRSEGLFLAIGTAGYNTFGTGWEERQLAIEVLEGKRDRLDIFAALFTIDPEDVGNWTSERVIRKANPNLGISLDFDVVMIEVEGIATNPRNKAEVLRTRFNVWGLGESRLISKEHWDKCAVPDLTVADFTGKKCWIGVDLATRNDMVSWVIEFEHKGGVAFFAKHYVPEFGPWIEDEEIRDIYTQWHLDGYLAFTSGSHHSYDEILKDILQLNEDFNVEAIMVDDREANALMAALEKKKLPVLAFRKNATNYSEPTFDIVARTVGKFKTVHHGGNPILGWNVENTIGGLNTAGLILPKKVSEHSNMKIDGFDCMVEAHAGFMEEIDMTKLPKVQPMADRGVRILQ